MADVSSYNSQVPSGTSEIRLGDDLLRSRGSDMHAAWTEEHFFRDGSAASGGQHKPGSSRMSFGNGPAITSGDEGRVFYDVDDNILTVQGSSATTTPGNPCASGIIANATLDIPQGSESSVTFNKAVYDRGGFINFSGNSAHKLDVQVDGIYQIDSHVAWAGNPGITTDSQTSTYQHQITQNSDPISEYEVENIGGEIDQTTISVMTQASAGDSFSMRVLHDEGSSHVLLGARISIQKIG